jgi:hypothetical protein
MTQEHWNALLAVSEAKKQDQGFLALPEGRSLTLYVAAGSTTLAITRVQTMKLEGALVHARTNKGEHYVVALQDVYAGSVDTPTASTAKKAGFL